MKAESTSLYYREGSSDKVYQAELTSENGGWVVNFAYGRRGSSLNTGSKTPAPVSYDQAKKIYDKIIKEKTAKGYTVDPSGKVFQGAISGTIEDTGVRPQLLNPIEEGDIEQYLSDPNWCMQEKFDGRRRLLFCEGAQSYGANRKGLRVDITDRVLVAVQDLPPGTVLDGEDMGENVFCFDMIVERGTVSSYNYYDRYMRMVKTMGNQASLPVARTAWTTKDKRKFFKELVDSKAEGVVFKDIRMPYTPGRPSSGGTQVKFKFVETASCVVTGIGNTKRSVSLGVFDGPKLIEVGNATVYPNQNIPPIGSIVEVKYLYYFPGGSLYQPILLNERDDIGISDCTLSKLKTKQTNEE